MEWFEKTIDIDSETDRDRVKVALQRVTARVSIFNREFPYFT